jgi:hypothetical protein
LKDWGNKAGSKQKKSKAMERGSNLILADLRGFQKPESDYTIRENPLHPRYPRSIAVVLCSLIVSNVRFGFCFFCSPS